MKRLAILSTHPIQYNAPLFRLMAEQENWGSCLFQPDAKTGELRSGFPAEVAWDTPLTEGCAHSFVDATTSSGVKG